LGRQDPRPEHDDILILLLTILIVVDDVDEEVYIRKTSS